MRCGVAALPAHLRSSARASARPVHDRTCHSAGLPGLEVGRGFDLALPVYAQPLVRGVGGITRDPRWLRVILRLRPGQSIDAATVAARAAQPAIRENSLPLPIEWRSGFLVDPFVMEPTGRGTSSLRSRYGDSLITLFGLAALVGGRVRQYGCSRAISTAVMKCRPGAPRGRVLRHLP